MKNEAKNVFSRKWGWAHDKTRQIWWSFHSYKLITKAISQWKELSVRKLRDFVWRFSECGRIPSWKVNADWKDASCVNKRHLVTHFYDDDDEQQSRSLGSKAARGIFLFGSRLLLLTLSKATATSCTVFCLSFLWLLVMSTNSIEFLWRSLEFRWRYKPYSLLAPRAANIEILLICLSRALLDYGWNWKLPFVVEK